MKMSTSSITSSSTCEGTKVFSTSPLSQPRQKMYDKCPMCKVQFDFIKRANFTKVPLILNCKHTVCEDCIRRMCLSNKSICPVCGDKFTVLGSQINSLSDIFQPHYTLIGYLVWTKNLSPMKEMSWISSSRKGKYSAGSDLMDLDISEKPEESETESSNIILSFTFDKCTVKEHTNEYANVHCEECDDLYCVYCFLENHHGHKSTYAYKLSEPEMVDLEKCRADAEVVLQQLMMSLKQAKRLSDFNSSDVEQDLRSYFIDLHAKLHLAEHNIRKKLSSVESEEINLDSVNFAMKSAMQRITQFLEHFKLLNTKQLNVQALYEEAKAVRDVPCRLISSQAPARPLEILNEDVFGDIESNFSLKNISGVEYNLVPIEDWSEIEEVTNLTNNHRHENNVPKVETKTLHNARTTNHTKSNEGKIRVVITHINDLDSFYIQKYSTLESLKEMNNIIEKKGRRGQFREDLKIGQTYGVLYEIKNSSHWRRGKLVDIVQNEDRSFLHKIFFVDYGNTKTVTRDKLKELDSYTSRRQIYAYECKLAKSDKENFEPNVHLQLSKIVKEKELYVRFSNPQTSRKSINEVELLVSASNGGVISVRDLLLKKPTKVLQTTYFSPEIKLFKNSTNFNVGQEEQVVVTYVKDPSYICVQLVRHCQIIEKMRSEMEDHYKTAPEIDCIPVVDTDVVVLYNDADQGSFHRAKITFVDISKKEVGAYLVDWGKEVIVPWSSLKQLTENFIRVECQGIIVKLVHVNRENEDEPWSAAAINFLRDQLKSDNEFRMVVTNVEGMEVALFQLTPSADICINSLLVENNYTISTGPISQTTMWPHMLDLPSEDDSDLSYQLMKKSEKNILADDDDQSDDVTKFQVTVVDFKSPDLIYVKLAINKEKEAELHKELQIHYTTKPTEIKSSWKPGEICVVFDGKQGIYVRGIIKSKFDKGNYIVYVYDHAKEVKVYHKKIFSQHPYFQQFPCQVVKCHLTKIKPAGDGGKWSQQAVEMLDKIFKTYKNIHIAKQEINIEEKMIGVAMWYTLTVIARALEPAKVQLVSINQCLIESGLAFSSPTLGAVKTEPQTPSDSKNPSWNDLIAEAEADLNVSNDSEDFQPTYQDGWPKASKVRQRCFDAVLVCVDTEGFFLIRDEELQSAYTELEKEMSATFKSTWIPSTADEDWQVNDMCTILSDDLFYRGTILEVNSDEINVEMIDFGSSHKVSKDELSKGIMYPDIPPLIYKVKLYDVHSVYGEWSNEDFEAVLSLVTDDVKIEIKGDLNVDIPTAEIYLNTGLSVNDLITSKLPHMKRTESYVVLEEPSNTEKDADENEIQVTNGDVKYNYVGPLEKKCGRQKMFVVNVLNFECNYSVVLRSDEIISTRNFTRLCNTIQKDAESQPVLQNIYIDHPCICIHKEKNLWSRAIIYSVANLQFKYVLVYFVDYGTVEMMPVQDIKEIRSDWLEFPVYLHIAGINVELLQKSQADSVLMAISHIRAGPVLVEVISEDPLKVHLYEGDRFIYQDLVDSGVIKLG